MDSVKIRSVLFTKPERVDTAYHSEFWYKGFSYEVSAVYIFRNKNKEVLYVGYTENLKKRIEQHFSSSKFKDEIQYIDYVERGRMSQKDLHELEKILWFFLKPEYSKKKIFPRQLYQMERIEK